MTFKKSSALLAGKAVEFTQFRQKSKAKNMDSNLTCIYGQTLSTSLVLSRVYNVLAGFYYYVQ